MSTVVAAPVTMLISRHIAPDRYHAFTAWMREGEILAAGFPGFLGSGVLHPPDGQAEYQIVIRFETTEALDRWEKSLPRSMWLERGASMVQHSRSARMNGTGSWFGAKPLAPPRWKQAVSIWVVYFPVLLLFTATLQDQLAQIPLFWRIFITTATMCPVLTYFLMPAVTRVLRGWLYKP